MTNQALIEVLRGKIIWLLNNQELDPQLKAELKKALDNLGVLNCHDPSRTSRHRK